MKQHRYKICLVFALVVTILFLGAPPAAAHRPLWEQGEVPLHIPNLDTSFAAYADLETHTQIDTYVFSAAAGERLQGDISVPAIEGLENYQVQAALFGPGLPRSTPKHLLPPEYPDEGGAYLFPSQVTEDFFEPFTQTNYWGRQSFEVTLPEDGTYYLLVWNPAGQTGKYVLATGVEEIFGPTDLFRFPLWWIQVHAYFEHSFLLVIPLAAVFVLAVFLIWRRRRQHTPVFA